MSSQVLTRHDCSSGQMQKGGCTDMPQHRLRYGHHFLVVVSAASTTHFTTTWKAKSVVGECLKSIGKAEYGESHPSETFT